MTASVRSLAFAAGLIVSLHGYSAAAANFVFTPLVVPNGLQPAYVIGVYQNQAVGVDTISGQSAGFVWSDGSYTVFPSIPRPVAVSDNGLVMGLSASSSSSYSIYNIATGATTTYMFTPTGGAAFIPGAVNASGEVTATQEIETRNGHHTTTNCRPFVQDTSGAFTFLTNAQKPKFVAFGLTDGGVAFAAPSSCPFAIYDLDIYKGGKFRPFKILGGDLIQTQFINSAGLFGGTYETQNEERLGFTSKGGAATNYSVPGAGSTVVSGVDSHGNVFGYTFDPSNVNHSDHGFVYAKGNYYQLDVPGHKYTMITAVSSTGAIIGYFGDKPGPGGQPDQPYIATCPSNKGCTK